MSAQSDALLAARSMIWETGKSARFCAGVGMLWSMLSGGAPILVMQTAKVWTGDDLALVRGLNRSWVGTLFAYWWVLVSG